MTYAEVAAAVSPHALAIIGALHEDGETIMLLGPGRDFWEAVQTAPEMQDGAPDPFDRWSTRVITGLAQRVNASPVFPFGGPPYAPFLGWALASRRAWSSPIGMLVHDEAGLMVSFRGALRLPGEMDLPPPPAAAPCATCAGRPCTTACPVGALSDQHFYKVETCHAYLDTRDGQDCMTAGCIARRACPVSQAFDRPAAQSALHMRYFHPS